MATEIREEGYESIRQFVDSGRATPGSWQYIELRDGTDSAVTRIDIDGDARASWIHAAGDQTLVVEVEVQGSDSDIPTGTTFTASANYNTDTGGGGSELAWDSFPDATIETEDDTLVVTHEIEVPQV